MKDRLWKCRDGRIMTVAQMDTRHILNSIAMIKRSRRHWRCSYLSRLELELLIRQLPEEHQ